jgi:hypothetical protein
MTSIDRPPVLQATDEFDPGGLRASARGHSIPSVDIAKHEHAACEPARTRVLAPAKKDRAV